MFKGWRFILRKDKHQNKYQSKPEMQLLLLDKHNKIGLELAESYQQQHKHKKLNIPSHSFRTN